MCYCFHISLCESLIFFSKSFLPFCNDPEIVSALESVSSLSSVFLWRRKSPVCIGDCVHMNIFHNIQLNFIVNTSMMVKFFLDLTKMDNVTWDNTLYHRKFSKSSVFLSSTYSVFFPSGSL